MALRQEKEVRTLSRRELMVVLDERAQRYLGMSGAEFLKALEKGTLPDSPAVTHLAMLVGEGR
ncbi:MAG: hypothetical protein M3391_09220 [Actinomycetota bacterium]|nr:hypothetical protein [Actinomycetota bacterium]